MAPGWSPVRIFSQSALFTAFLLSLGIGIAVGQARIGAGYDTSLPIEITSTSLEVQQEEQTAVFTGKVDASQGKINLRADQLVVHYRKDSKESNAIRLIEAFGNVFLSSPTEMAQGTKGVYNLDTNKVELNGDVVLTRGENVIRGDRLVIDLATGVSRVLSGVAGTKQAGRGSGRVRALFVPGSDDME